MTHEFSNVIRKSYKKYCNLQSRDVEDFTNWMIKYNMILQILSYKMICQHLNTTQKVIKDNIYLFYN